MNGKLPANASRLEWLGECLKLYKARECKISAIYSVILLPADISLLIFDGSKIFFYADGRAVSHGILLV